MKFIIHFESSFLTVSSRINHPIKSYAHKTQPDLEHILTIYESPDHATAGLQVRGIHGLEVGLLGVYRHRWGRWLNV
ncbi:hypothetical protein C5S42_06230 [Candidatus Methanomarinus sp.]|nr:hypothetical protein C5S42_06230 [ANME-2 cluster archaeon]